MVDGIYTPEKSPSPPPVENKAFQIWEFYLSFFSKREGILVIVYYTPLTKVYAS